MIAKPTMMPVTYHNHVQPKFASEMLLVGIGIVDMKFQHRFVHLRTFGKTDRAPLQAFEPRAKIGVARNELPLTIFAAIALFLLSSFAILLDVQ